VQIADMLAKCSFDDVYIRHASDSNNGQTVHCNCLRKAAGCGLDQKKNARDLNKGKLCHLWFHTVLCGLEYQARPQADRVGWAVALRVAKAGSS
jgi:hypothetical protein